MMASVARKFYLYIYIFFFFLGVCVCAIASKGRRFSSTSFCW